MLISDETDKAGLIPKGKSGLLCLVESSLGLELE